MLLLTVGLHSVAFTLHLLMCVCVLLLLQRVEEEERAEEAAGARITKKKKTNKSKQGGRQAKLTGSSTDSGNSFKETRPSPFAEVVDPVIPEFSTERKTAGKGRGRVKAEPKSATTGEGAGDDPKQKKLKFEGSDKTKEEGGGGGKAKKAPGEKPSQAKKRKVKEMVDSFIISSDSEEEGEEEGEIEKKSLRERIELRKTKVTHYTEEMLSGEESVESEASWKSGSDDDRDAPPIKKAKLAGGGSKTAVASGETAGKSDIGGETTEAKAEGKTKKTVLKPDGGGETKGKGKKEPTASKPTAAAKPSAKPPSKPSAKGGAGKTTSSSSSGSSGEKKKRGKAVLGRKRVVSHEFFSDDESDYNIESGSGSDSLAVPAKKVATEVSGYTVANTTQLCNRYRSILYVTKPAALKILC